MATNPRVALVTGGMGGLGEAICIKMAALGYRVVTTHSPGNTKAAEWLGAMKGQGFDFRAYGCDVADWDSAAACAQKVAGEVGPIDVLVNNAGITRDMTFKKMDKTNWDMVIKTNLDSCFNMTKQVCDGMVDRNWGRIINISSVNGQKGAFGQTNYSAAKAGMHGFTKALALKVARRHVTVNDLARLHRRKMVMAIPKEVLDSRSFRRSRWVASASRRKWRASSRIWRARRLRSSPGNIAINGGQHMF
jgi:acetoacetyl-CoA reductase